MQSRAALSKATRRKVQRGKCATSGCRNLHRRKRTICHKCIRRRWRKAHPMKSAYRALKDHAKARGIQFTITFKYFERFAIVTKYLCKTGNTGDSLTVDRRDNLQGYVPGNIQPMTRSKNSEKLARSDARRMRCGYKWVDESPEDFIEDGEHQKEREAA